MKIGIYGGTFSPVHNGHIAMAKSFAEQCDIDRLLIIPTFLPPHKSEIDGASVSDRVNMLKLAMRDVPKAEISLVEIERGEVSYTVDTLKGLRDMGELYMLCGSDMFLSLETWRCPDEIFGLAKIFVGRRENDIETGEKIRAYKKDLEERRGIEIGEIKFDAVVMSSSDIREKIINGESLDGYVPADVEAYISENNLYK